MQSRDRDGELADTRDRRGDQAQRREDAADRREQEHDIREGVLDRWERELTERASSLGFLEEADEASRDLARRRRAEAHRQRRADAEDRRAAATERGIETAMRSGAEHRASSGAHLDAQGQRALDRLAALVDTGATLPDTLNAILAIATDAFTDAAAVTVSLTVDGRLQPAASSTTWAGELDAVQLRDRVGPITDAIETRTVVVSSDLAADERWHLAGSIGPTGNRGVLSAAIVVGPAAPGALTVYAAPGRGFDRHSVVTAALVAAQASLAVGWSLDRLAHRAQTEAWERALASRDSIGQAKGILMEQLDLTADEAFELLRNTSQRHNTKVRDIADHVAAHRRLPDPPT